MISSSTPKEAFARHGLVIAEQVPVGMPPMQLNHPSGELGVLDCDVWATFIEKVAPPYASRWFSDYMNAWKSVSGRVIEMHLDTVGIPGRAYVSRAEYRALIDPEEERLAMRTEVGMTSDSVPTHGLLKFGVLSPEGVFESLGDFVCTQSELRRDEPVDYALPYAHFVDTFSNLLQTAVSLPGVEIRPGVGLGDFPS